MTSPFDLLALGRHHTIYFDLVASLHSAVFLLNSRYLGLFLCPLFKLIWACQIHRLEGYLLPKLQ